MGDEIKSPKYNFGGREWFLIAKSVKNGKDQSCLEVTLKKNKYFESSAVFVFGLFSIINQNDGRENYYQSNF